MNNEAYFQIVNKTDTFRSKRRHVPLVYVEAKKQIRKNQDVLDFGAGKEAVWTTWLTNNTEGEIFAFDIGDNYDPMKHRALALDRRYDWVLASNVLNVQPTLEDIQSVILTLSRCGDRVLVNYPISPRKSFEKIDVFEIYSILKGSFSSVMCIAGTPASPVFRCLNVFEKVS